jgi:hypothetical protein
VSDKREANGKKNVYIGKNRERREEVGKKEYNSIYPSY